MGGVPMPHGLQMINHIVNAVRERLDVRRIDRGEDSDAQLIASQRAISVHIDMCGTDLIMALTVLSPVLGLVFYKPATSTTMLSMYLANPAIAGGVAGAILFGLLTIFELDRACRSRVDLSLIHI